MRLKEYSRYELKYLITIQQQEQLLAALANYLEPDSYGDRQGRYAITSVYYDSPDYQAYWDKIEGHRFRRKVRVRVYGDQVVTPQTNCFVEIKQRINKTLQKKRLILPYNIATALCSAGAEIPPEFSRKLPAEDLAVADEVRYLHHSLQLQPACVVSYDRLAFDGSDYDPSLRVTFDTNLKGRVHDVTLLSQGFAQSQFAMPPTWCVMEVKVNYRVPYWLTQLINRHDCILRRISKYCTALEQTKTIRKQQHIVF